ncbi:ROK family transcriptional regulator [Bacillus sp. FJAT-50079]|uniref:ROK family transcriptional regulator n=1 Tax=Bacillus sp. FJAT-50079 TaxID=2833577 RepID=UPI001BC94951|nr:ROK family transcriptional regulator [Bacillus sp. FJAT-50079]MBS4206939.1 ROK family transcriptional regulator [Bacillus sp. FJAT-50079]
MVTGDAAYIKKLNRGLILSKIVEHNGISRANLSKETGLNKATISVQVADLLQEGLLVEEQQEHTNLGRRPIILRLNRKAGYALGIDLDKSQVIFTLSDLLGSPVQSKVVSLHTIDYEEIVKLLTDYISNFKNICKDSTYGITGVVIGIHGTVSNDEIISFVPQLHWREKNLKADLEKQIALPIHIENNANLTALAERVYKHHHSDSLLSITMQSGMGLGMIMKGELLRGFHGYAGEMGHMIVVPDGKECACGNHGCWEQYASEANFFRELAKESDEPKLTFLDVKTLLKADHQQTHQKMNNFIKYVAIGMNNLINLYNPQTIVLNSELLRIYPDAVNVIKQQLTSRISHYGELFISDLGENACVMGACVLSIKNFLGISNLSLNLCDEYVSLEHINMQLVN